MYFITLHTPSHSMVAYYDSTIIISCSVPKNVAHYQVLIFLRTHW